jgi:hypothetical protein
MPDEGESIQQLFEAGGPFAGSLVAAAIRPVPFTNPDGSEGVDLWLDRELFPAAFCADVDPETAKVMAATQRPWSGAGYGTPSGPPGWRSIPSWYLVGTEDRAIPPAGQRFMAERGNAQIEEVAASHASMVSQPEAVTRLILRAVETTTKAHSSRSRQGGVSLTATGLGRAASSARGGSLVRPLRPGWRIWPDGAGMSGPQEEAAVQRS